MAELFVDLSAIWLAVGAVVALVFLGYGVDRILEDARGVYLFRALVAPGVILLWPIVLMRWRLKERDAISWKSHHQPRRGLAGVLEIAMALALMVILLTALFITDKPQNLPEPVKLSQIEFVVEERV